LLKGYVVPVVDQRGRGVIILRGLTTDGDQISVRRVADRAVRGVKLLGELFIGRLNSEDGRGALKQKLNEFLVQMEKEGELVVKSANYLLDTHLSEKTSFQLVANLKKDQAADAPKRTLSFDDCYVEGKSFGMDASGSAVTTYAFSATRVREE
jgi:hypothetical protein